MVMRWSSASVSSHLGSPISPEREPSISAWLVRCTATGQRRVLLPGGKDGLGLWTALGDRAHVELSDLLIEIPHPDLPVN
jgi:hypothetical protein